MTSNVIKRRFLITSLLFILLVVVSGSYSIQKLDVFAQTSSSSDLGNGPIPEDNSTDVINGPIPEDNSTFANNDFNPQDNFTDPNTIPQYNFTDPSATPQDTPTDPYAASQDNLTNAQNQISNATTPEFGPVSVLVLTIGVIAIILVSVRSRFSWNIK
jgi:predicted secreted protein with PEFG-CTERM motif